MYAVVVVAAPSMYVLLEGESLSLLTVPFLRRYAVRFAAAIVFVQNIVVVFPEEPVTSTSHLIHVLPLS